MKKAKYIILLLTLLLLFPYTTYADCSEEIEYFKEHEDEYKVTYNFYSDSNTYDIKFINPEPDRYEFGIVGDIELNCNIDNPEEIECYGLSPGEYRTVVISTDDECSVILKDDIIKLSGKNKYYNDPLCEGIEEFVLCQETYDKEIDYDTFSSRVETYKKTKTKEKTIETEPDSELTKIVDYLKSNVLEIIVITAFIVALIVTLIITIKNIKKSRRLE